MRAAATFIVPLAMLAACSDGPEEPAPTETEVPEELAEPSPLPSPAEDAIGTPMAERVATLGLLNKRNNISQDIELSPGESRRQGDVIIRLSACERTKPWEFPEQTGAFVQVLVQDASADSDSGDWRKVFSGWLIKESPSVNVVEHPIYDVWVKDCAMSFPGEEPARASSASNASGNSDSGDPDEADTSAQ